MQHFFGHHHGKKKKLGQFLLIQQFWLMGTTSIPQPVITTAQFPISALLARKSSSGCQFSAISQLVLNLFLESAQANTRGGAGPIFAPQQVTGRRRRRGGGSHLPRGSRRGRFRKGRMWEKALEVATDETEDLFCLVFVPFPAPGLTDSPRSLGWQHAKPRKLTIPFSEDVPVIRRRSVPCQGGALGVSQVKTPTV